MFDYLVVGAGFAGSVLAERLASQTGARALIVEQRSHIGGNAYDHYDDAGLLVHKYGPHIFHTNAKEVFDYLSQFTAWRPYQHRVLAERLASVYDKKVLIVEKRPHIGGNAYDHYNDDGVHVHKYGPHIFHTNSKYVFE